MQVSSDRAHLADGGEKIKRTGFGKCSAVLLYVLGARGDPSLCCAALFLSGHSGRCPHATRPVTAEGGVKDRRMILEKLERVAGARGPERAGRAPRRGYGSICCDIGRDVVPGEEPDLDATVVP